LSKLGLNPYRHSVRDQYDSYFLFTDQDPSRLRFREDEVKDDEGNLQHTFYTMTLVGQTGEKEFKNSILLTRARYTASATHSLRFYREYFKPSTEQEVIKLRRRCHINFQGTDFAINLDHVSSTIPNSVYLEIKSRTWSAKDALRKADLIAELLDKLEIKTENLLKTEYIDSITQE